MNKTVSYAAVAIILLVVSFFISRRFKRNQIPQINLSAIAITDLNGHQINMAGFSGKPLVINFWGTWCGPCRQELPTYEKIKVKYDTLINLLMVSDEPGDKIERFKEDNSYTFMYACLQKRFSQIGIPSVPFTYFYDRTGKLVFKKKDPLKEEELNQLINKMIKE